MSVFNTKDYGPDSKSARLNTHRRPGLSVTIACLLGAVNFIGVPSVSLAQPSLSNKALGANLPLVKDAGGFPLWYQDNSGIRVQLCQNPNDPYCLAPVARAADPKIGDPGYNPALPTVFPDNYPDEMFYAAVDSQAQVADPLLTGCNNTANGVANPGVWGHFSLEAAFSGAGTVQPGAQMVFGRTRIKATAGSNLCPSTWYTFRTPYGPVTIQTETNGTISGAAASASTIDVGCLPAGAATCDFELALKAPVLAGNTVDGINGVPANTGGLLQFANMANARPGYLGSTDGAVPPAPVFAPVQGSTYSYDGGVTFFNKFEVLQWPADVTPNQTGFGADCFQGCTTVASTANFSVLTKLAGPLQADVTPLDFGGVTNGTISQPKTINITNLGSGQLGLQSSHIDSVSITGPNHGSFSAKTGTCLAAATSTVNRDASCNINVTYTPGTAVAAHTATLDVFANGVKTTPALTIPLLGSGIANGSLPVITSNPANQTLAFGNVRYSTASGVLDFTVINNGSSLVPPVTSMAPLSAIAADPVDLDTGAAVPEFQKVVDTCSQQALPINGTCKLSYQYVPTAAVGIHNAVVRIQTNSAINADASGVFVLNLTANATGGIAKVAEYPPLWANAKQADGAFPEWYQDETGARLGQCDDVTNPHCITAGLPKTTLPEAFPTNYPNEAFYYLATSFPVDASDCDNAPGKIFVEAGVESAFLGQVTPGQGITFGRLRIVSHGGLCPNTDYRITHPYGEVVLTTDGNGAIKPHAGTFDVGCLGAPCDYKSALASPVLEGFLEQTNHPAGYLGDPIISGNVTGAPFKKTVNGVVNTPVNFFEVRRDDDNTLIASTDQFNVSGRLIGPMTAAPNAWDFGTVRAAVNGVNGGLATKTFTFTNEGINAVNTTLVSITGAHPGDFSVLPADNGCTSLDISPVSLLPGQSCTVKVTFAPTALGQRDANLVLNHTGRNNPLSVAMTGVGAVDIGAAISSPLNQVKFVDLAVDSTSESAKVPISNIGGTADLIVASAILLDDPTAQSAQSDQFAITNNCQAPVSKASKCEIWVRFKPNSIGEKKANLVIESNAGPLTLPIVGKAVNSGTAQSSASLNGFNTWYQDNNAQRLEQCLSTDGNCALLADPGFNPNNPIVFPSNYPLESFYFVADSDPTLTISPHKCPDGTIVGGAANNLAVFHVATEATFTSTTVQDGAQTTFNRVRFTASGLCPGETYTVIHPYNTTRVIANLSNTNKPGQVGPNTLGGTVDITNVIGSNPLTSGYLQWDPNVQPTAPAGYIGDYRVLHTIVGSQYRMVAGGEPVNYVEVWHGTDLVARTDKFLVSGRRAGPMASDLIAKNFGTQEAGTVSTGQNFTISNVGPDALSGITASLSGANSSEFIVDNALSNCATAQLATNETCKINVKFSPAPTATVGAIAKSATLTLTSSSNSGLGRTVVISLTGTSMFGDRPVLTASITSQSFTATAVGSSVVGTQFTLKNTGTSDVGLSLTADPTGINPASKISADFFVSSTNCGATLFPNASCNVILGFKPTGIGTKSTLWTVTGTDPNTLNGNSIGGSSGTGTSTSISLTGTGQQGTITVNSSTVTIKSAADVQGTAKLTVSNTGTAPLTVSAINIAQPAGNRFNITGNSCLTTLAVKANCSFTITWTPTTQAPAKVNGSETATYTIVSNASNPAAKVTATGTRTK